MEKVSYCLFVHYKIMRRKFHNNKRDFQTNKEKIKNVKKDKIRLIKKIDEI